MKYLHNIQVRVFAREDDDEEKIKKTLKELISLDFEKIEFTEQNALGAHDDKITVFSVFVKKQRHTTAIVKHLMEQLSSDQKLTLLKQMESRLDEDLHFFIRLQKDKLMEGEYRLTDSGRCFHINMSIAAYPHKREAARRVLKEMLTL